CRGKCLIVERTKRLSRARRSIRREKSHPCGDLLRRHAPRFCDETGIEPATLTRVGAPIAIKAMAAKLARLVYRTLRYGMQFVDHGAKFYEAQRRKQQINYLKWKAARLGFQITEASAS